jgi:hypothetical protein
LALERERINFEYPPAEPLEEKKLTDYRGRMELASPLPSRDRKGAVVKD